MASDLKCMHGRSISVRCDDCAWMAVLPDDGWYRVICFSPEGIAVDDWTAPARDRKGEQ